MMTAELNDKRTEIAARVLVAMIGDPRSLGAAVALSLEIKPPSTPAKVLADRAVEFADALIVRLEK